MTLMEGAAAPDFHLPDKDGKLHSLKDFVGKTIVLYFYPEDDTPGCTVEACEFRDAKQDIASRGAFVIGISKDSPESHEAFDKKYGLNFLLLSDAEHKVISAYGSWGLKIAGKEFEGTLRNTFIIGPDGRIKKIFTGVTPKGHAKQVLDAIG